MLRDRLAESHTVLRIGDGEVNRLLRKAYALCRHADTGVVQDFHCQIVALIFHADEMVCRHMHFIKDDVGRCRKTEAHLILVLTDGNAHAITLNKEAGDAAVSLFRSRLCEHAEELRMRGIGDKALAPIKNIFVSRFDRRGAQCGCIRTRVRFSKRKGCHTTIDHGIDYIALLLVRTGNQHGAAGKLARAKRVSKADIAHTQLLVNNRLRVVVQSKTAKLLRKRHRGESHISSFLVQLRRRVADHVPFGRDRTDLLVREFLRKRLQVFLFISQNKRSHVLAPNISFCRPAPSCRFAAPGSCHSAILY